MRKLKYDEDGNKVGFRTDGKRRRLSNYSVIWGENSDFFSSLCDQYRLTKASCATFLLSRNEDWTNYKLTNMHLPFMAKHLYKEYGTYSNQALFIMMLNEHYNDLFGKDSLQWQLKAQRLAFCLACEDYCDLYYAMNTRINIAKKDKKATKTNSVQFDLKFKPTYSTGRMLNKILKELRQEQQPT